MKNHVEYVNGYDYGVGVNSLTGEICGFPVEKNELSSIENASGQEVHFTMDMITSMESLQRSIGISGEGNMSYGPVSGGAKGKFVKDSSFNSYSVFLLVRVSVQNAFTQMRNLQLTQDALSVLEKGSRKQFRKQYGDQFVRGIGTGGEYIGLIEIETKNNTDKQQIAAEANINYNNVGVSADFKAKFASNLSSSIQNRSISVKNFINGGKNIEMPDTFEEILDLAIKFPNLVSGEHAKPFTVMLGDIEFAQNFPIQSNEIDLMIAKNNLSLLTQDRNGIFKILNDVNYVLRNQNQFVSPSILQLNDYQDKLTRRLNAISTAISNCANDPVNASLPQLPAMPELQLPKRKDKPVIVGWAPKGYLQKDKLNGQRISLIFDENDQSKIQKNVHQSKFNSKLKRSVNQSSKAVWEPFNWNTLQDFFTRDTESNKPKIFEVKPYYYGE